MNIGSIGRKATGICLAVLAAAAFGGAALAQPHERPGRVLRALRGGLATLDLTADQKDEIKAIFDAKKAGFEAQRAKMKADATALHDAASADKPDPAAVGTAFLKVRANREGAKASFKALMTEVNGVLTPDQQKKLDGYLSAMRQMGRGRHGGPATP